MWRIFSGAALVVAGIAAFIEASSHSPGLARRCSIHPAPREGCPVGESYSVHVGLSQTPYDLLRIGGWALVIVGALLIVLGLIGYWARIKHPA
jgi:hypothetical protein